MRELYDSWAPTYQSFTRSNGRVHGVISGELLTAAMLKNPITKARDRPYKVFEAGTGTGLSSKDFFEPAKKAGFDLEIVGTDLSPGMLAEAEKLGIFAELTQVDLLKQLPFEEKSFDAWLCIGVLFDGHLGPEILTNIAPIIKTGAVGMITVRSLTFTTREEEYEKYFKLSGFKVIDDVVDSYNNLCDAHYITLLKL